MPLLITMKEPPVTQVARGTIEDLKKGKIEKAVGEYFVVEDKDGSKLLIPGASQSNIAHIREITPEKLAKIELKQKEQEEKRKEAEAGRGGRIQPVTMVPPGKRGKRH